MILEKFYMIDCISEIDLGSKYLVAHSVVPEESSVFEGHFPGYPLVPGVLMIEIMAQASGILIMHILNFAKIPLLAGVKNGKIRDFIGPKKKLDIKATVEYEGSGFAIARGAIYSEGKRVANSRLTYTIRPFPSRKLQDLIKVQVKNMKVTHC